MSDVQNSVQAGLPTGDSDAAVPKPGDAGCSIHALDGQGEGEGNTDDRAIRGSLLTRSRATEPSYRRSLFRR